MVVIPAGRFLMGAPKDETQRENNERPHEVVIKRAFALGKYPVTFEEYDRFCVATKRDKPSDEGWGRDQRPVIYVNWPDAMAYCAWLSEQTGQAYRLPTEAEWEYACRAGTTTPFYFGATISTDQANYDGRSTYGSGRQGTYRQHTTPVGEFPANAWGLYDMHGTVWEWTGSVYDTNYGGAEQRRADANESDYRVVRGGSWVYSPGRLRSASRFRYSPDDRNSGLGFRISRSL
jgi:formylglycine-generating enzyme required for sulfatase activity